MNHNQELANKLVALAAGLLDGSVILTSMDSDVESHTYTRRMVGGGVKLERTGEYSVKLNLEYQERR